jgi:hypothetical protein
MHPSLFLYSLGLISGLVVSPAAAQVKITQGSDRMMIEIDGKPFTDFFTGADTRKPYLHPLRSASGKIVTRRYPMEMIEGESRDHVHHRGLWFTHGDVNGIDFWANDATQKGKKGRVVLRKIVDLKSGKKSGTIAARFEWLDVEDSPLLAEQRTMIFYSEPTTRTIDIDIVLTALAPAKFGDTKEGTFAIRLAEPLTEKKGGGGMMVNAQGAEKEKNVWGKQSEWVDYHGELEGEKLGIAIFDHPSNPRHPTYWHSRSYGLFAANIFGVKDFTGDKTRDGSLALDKGKSMRFRYRVLIHPGDARTAAIPEQYKKFAAMK